MAEPTMTMRERVSDVLLAAIETDGSLDIDATADAVLAELETPTEGMIAAALPIIQPHPSQDDIDLAGRALSLLDPQHKVSGRNAAAGISAALQMIIDFRAAIRAAREGRG